MAWEKNSARKEYTMLQEFIVEIRDFTVSLHMFSSTMTTDVDLSQSNKFTVFLVLCHITIWIATDLAVVTTWHVYFYC